MSNILSPVFAPIQAGIKSFPSVLLGTWEAENPSLSVKFMRFFDAGGAVWYYASTDAVPFQINSAGTILNWNGAIFFPVGTPQTKLQGLWSEDNGAQSDQVYFKDGGQYTWYFQPGQQTFGIWSVASGTLSSGTLKTEEFRATVTADSNTIDFDLPYGNDESINYTLVGTQLTLVSAGNTYIYNKV